MKRIGEDVVRELSRFGPAAGMADAVRVWPTVVGEAVAGNAWPARFARDGTLHVATSSSTWAFELVHHEREILGRLREELGEAAPPRLRFAPGPMPEATADTASAPAPRRPEATLADREQAQRIAAPISDENLRELVARAAAASLARAAADRGL
jgi:hypothetical protein